MPNKPQKISPAEQIRQKNEKSDAINKSQKISNSSKISPAERIRQENEKRAALIVFTDENRKNLSAAATQFGGTVRYAPQHDMIEKLRKELDDKYDWLREMQDGVAAGLASEWILHRAWNHDLVPAVEFATKGGFMSKLQIVGPALRGVIDAQNHRSVIERNQRLLSSHCIRTKTFKSQYPFKNLLNTYFPKILGHRYYFIEDFNHSMAAYVDPYDRVWLYDPNIGDVMWTRSRSIGLLPYYLSRRVETMVKHYEIIGKILGWPKNPKSVSLTFTEYTPKDIPINKVPPKRVTVLAKKTNDPGLKAMAPKSELLFPSNYDDLF